jgi:2-keto-4-pentenoate hydratase
MSLVEDLAHQLAEANKADRHDVDAKPYSQLDRDTALAVQLRVMQLLGQTPGLLKTAVAPDGVGVCAPIFASKFGQSGSFRLQSANITGLELEVGLVLDRDLDIETARRDEIDIVEAIDYYFVGIEICGTRYVDRSLAGFNGGLADGMSSLGYVMNPRHRDLGAEIDDFGVQLSLDGVNVHSAPARHSFGTVLKSFIAYAKNQNPAFPLKAGTIVTTGSLCGLVPISGTGHVTGQLGSYTVEFDIV